jgi:hypothetical protein
VHDTIAAAANVPIKKSLNIFIILSSIFLFAYKSYEYKDFILYIII